MQSLKLFSSSELNKLSKFVQPKHWYAIDVNDKEDEVVRLKETIDSLQSAKLQSEIDWFKVTRGDRWYQIVIWCSASVAKSIEGFPSVFEIEKIDWKRERLAEIKRKLYKHNQFFVEER